MKRGEWKEIAASAAASAAAGAMRVASDAAIDAEGTDVVRRAYTAVVDAEAVFCDDERGDLDYAIADALHDALDIATGVNNGKTAVTLAKSIIAIYDLHKEEK